MVPGLFFVTLVVLGMEAPWPEVSDHCLKDSASCYDSAAKTTQKDRCEKCRVVVDYLVKSVWLCAVCFRNQQLEQQNNYCTGRACYVKHCLHASLIQSADTRKRRVLSQHHSPGHQSGDFLGDHAGVHPILESDFGGVACLSAALVPTSVAPELAPSTSSPRPTTTPRMQ